MVDINYGKSREGSQLSGPTTMVHNDLFELALTNMEDTLSSSTSDNEERRKDFESHGVSATESAATALGLDATKAGCDANPSVSDGAGGWADNNQRWYAHPTYEGKYLARDGATAGKVVYSGTWVAQIEED